MVKTNLLSAKVQSENFDCVEGEQSLFIKPEKGLLSLAFTLISFIAQVTICSYTEIKIVVNLSENGESKLHDTIYPMAFTLQSSEHWTDTAGVKLISTQ